MLQALRDKTSGWFTIVLLSLLTVLLVLSGLQGYIYTSQDTSLAVVGNVKVEPSEFDQAFSRAREQAVQSGMSAKQFDTLEQRRKVLETLADQKLLTSISHDAGLLMSDQAVSQQIANDPTFQTDGKFDKQKYVQILNEAAFSETRLVELIKSQHAEQILPRSIYGTAMVTDSEVNDYLKLRDQTRDFKYFFIESSELPPQAAISEADIKSYYDLNSAKYMSADSADIEYLRIQASQLSAPPATDAALKADYDKQVNKYKTPEQRQASHILIEVEGGASAPADKQQAALEQAQALAQRAKAGEDFAELAKKYSKDVGSAGSGGDLGMTDNGANEPAFDTKLFAMKVGEISDPVLTSAGYHVIKLVAINPEKGKTFEEAKPQLLEEYNQRALDAEFNKVVGAAFSAAQADPRSLVTAAKAAGLTTQRTGMISRQGGADPLTSNRSFLDEVFSDAVFKRGNNTQLITISKNDQVIARIASSKPAAVRPLAEVKTDVEFAIKSERQAKALKTRADELVAKLLKAQTIDAVAKELGKTVEIADRAGRNAANRDPALSAEVFKAAQPLANKPVRFAATISPDKIAVVELVKVTDGNPTSVDKATRDSVREQLRFERSASEFDAFKRALKSNHKFVVHEERMAQSSSL